MTAGADKRRINGQLTREKLLAAGEQAFADHGFDGATTRNVADAEDTDIALIVYHFGSKLGLYREILLRRAKALNARRIGELDVALKASNGGVPDLRLIVKALVATNIRLRTDQELGGLPVARLFAREMIEPKQADRRIIGEMFGLNIFVAQSVLRMELKVIYQGILPFLGVYLVALALITYIPEISLVGVRLFMGG
uniref:MnbR n=1 Tax=Comamonas sp. JS46 TaxID=298265 RepID=Q5GDA3_9BURK|nr:MnbR [Comamonas sp. JS46]